MPASKSEWSGDEIVRALDDVSGGKVITSREWNSLAWAINQRIMSGVGDMMWRTGWSLHTLWSDIATNTLEANPYNFPRSDEWWATWAGVPDSDVTSALNLGDTGRSLNPWNPMHVFRDGFPAPGLNEEEAIVSEDRNDPPSEEDRLSNFGIYSSNAEAIWREMKSKRGYISLQHAKERRQGCRIAGTSPHQYAVEIKPQDTYGLPEGSLARVSVEILRVPRFISGFYNRLKTFGGRIINSRPGTIECDNQQVAPQPPNPIPEDETDPNPDNENPDYPDVPTPPIDEIPPEPEDPTLPDNPIDDPDDDGALLNDWGGDYLNPNKPGFDPNAPAWDFFIHERGAQFEQIMTNFIAEHRGVYPIGSKQDGHIRDTAFDFHRYFNSQNLIAPAKIDEANGYPSLSTTKIDAGDNFVIAGCLLYTRNEIEEDSPITVELELTRAIGGQSVAIKMVVELTSSEPEKQVFFSGGGVTGIRAVSLPSGVSGEVAILLEGRPRVWDCYALLRIRNTIPDVGNAPSKYISDEYFETGACIGPSTLPDAVQYDVLNAFPPYRSMKRFTNDLFRIFAYDRLLGYEVEKDEDEVIADDTLIEEGALYEVSGTPEDGHIEYDESEYNPGGSFLGKRDVTEFTRSDDTIILTRKGDQRSVFYFDSTTLAYGGLDTDMFHGLIHERKSTASRRDVSNEWAFMIGGRCPANGTDRPGKASQNIFKEQAYAQIRGAFVNPAYLFSRCLSKPYIGNREMPDPYLRARRANFGMLLRGLPTEGLGASTMTLFPEAPSGLNYRYGEDPLTQFSDDKLEEAKDYLQGANMFQAPYLINSIRVLSREEYTAKFSGGRVRNVGAVNVEGSKVDIQSVPLGKVVKVTLSSRLRGTDIGKERDVTFDAENWKEYSEADRYSRDKDAGGLGFSGIRSDENLVIDLLAYRSGRIASPPRRFGDFAPSATANRNAFPHTMWGSVFCRFFMMRLIPTVYADGNDQTNTDDTFVYSHLFRKAEYVIRASVGGFFDPDSLVDNTQIVGFPTSGDDCNKYTNLGTTKCEYLTPPRDYSMESLVSKRVLGGEDRDENLAIEKLPPEIARISGFGPVPNLDFTSGMFREFARAVNALVAVAIPNNFDTVYHRRINYGSSCPDQNDVLDGNLVGDACYLDFPEGNWTEDDGDISTDDDVYGVIGFGELGNREEEFSEPKSYNSPGYSSDAGDQDVPFEILDDGLPPDEWLEGGGGTGNRRWGLGIWGDSTQTAGRFDYIAVASSWNRDDWVVVTKEEFRNAFSGLLRSFVETGAFGRLVLEIRAWEISTGLYTETRERDKRKFGFESFNCFWTKPICFVASKGTTIAPSLPSSVTGTSTGYLLFPRGSRPHLSTQLGGHASKHIQNISENPDTFLVLEVEGQEGVDDPVCEEVERIQPRLFHQVLGGSGIEYGKDDSKPVAKTNYLDTQVFPPTFNIVGDSWELATTWKQLDPEDPSKVCLRADLGDTPGGTPVDTIDSLNVYYEVVGGSGIVYGHADGRPVSGVNTFTAGEIIIPTFILTAQPGGNVWRLVRTFTQVDTEDPSKLYKREDLGDVRAEDPRDDV